MCGCCVWWSVLGGVGRGFGLVYVVSFICYRYFGAIVRRFRIRRFVVG